MSTDIERLDAEIARLQDERRVLEFMPATIAERHAQVEARLRENEALYRAHGFDVYAGHPDQAAHLQRRAVLGALMAIDGDALLKVEHQRLAAAGEGICASDKARRLEEIARKILRAAARRELALRKVEQPGEFQPRPTHPELAIMHAADVEALATARQ